ncbi:hypothetical protein BGW39_011896 [Mortierella sp. 14UC]|nr:hypothetical protein BGW39_011896 [Mortierella sp. 14UC]
MLQVNYVSIADINLISSYPFGNQTDTERWSSGAEKDIKVVQFGRSTSYLGFIASNGTVGPPRNFASLEFQSSKLFSWVGSFTGSNYNMFHMHAVTPNNVTNSRWVGLRLNFLSLGTSYFSSSLDLNVVPSSGHSIPFSKSMAATAFNNKIITYTSPETGPAFINSFDLAAGKWYGVGLVSEETPSKVPIGGVVGGVVGGLLVIAIAVFFFIRRRRHRSAPKANDSTELAQLSPGVNKVTGVKQEYSQYDHEHTQHDQGYAQHDQGYVAYEQGYPQPPSFVPPPTSASHDTDISYKVPALTHSAASTASPTTTNSSYVSPTSYRDSTFPPGSPDSVFAKSNVSSFGRGPQLVPSSPGASSDARSPQSISP